MITAKDIRTAFVDLIHNKAQLPYDVYFNNVKKSDKSYIFVNFEMRKTSWDTVYFQRSIDVDIQVVLFPDEYAAIKYIDLWDISDSLTKAVMPCMQIKDRYITIQDFDSNIVDDVLHYEFNLDFTDCVPNDEYEGLGYELMQDLKLDLS